MKCTTFADMHSGGSKKNFFKIGYILGNEQSAIRQFTKKFGSPYHVTCDCCGQDYSIIEWDSEEEVLRYYPKAVKL